MARAQLVGARPIALIDDATSGAERVARASSCAAPASAPEGHGSLVLLALEAALAAPALAPHGDGADAIAEVWAVGRDKRAVIEEGRARPGPPPTSACAP